MIYLGQIARIPLLKSYDDFKRASDIGKRLSELHINYEELEPNQNYFKVEKQSLLQEDDSLYKVVKMKLEKREDNEPYKLIYNEQITIAEIPKEIENYKISGRTVLAWLIANYQIKTLDNGYIKDPNNYKGGKYIFDLVLSLITLAIESQKLTAQLPLIKDNYKT